MNFIAVENGREKIDRLNGFFRKYGSPLESASPTIILASEKYRLPVWLIVGIANAESSLGLYMQKGSHNPFGWKCYDGYPCHRFGSFDEAVYALTTTLRYESFYEDFRVSGNLFDIAKYYLTGNKIRWVNNVLRYRGELENL